MQVVWKYPLNIADTQFIEMTEGAEILCVHLQNGNPTIWAKVDPSKARKPRTKRKLITLGTGHNTDEKLGRYIGTYLIHNDSLVFHVFEGD